MSATVSTGVAITNPLIKYRALVATKAISPDRGQLRLALHLQKLYNQLKDYEPQVEYSQRLDQISKAVNSQHDNGTPHGDAAGPLLRDRIRSTWRALQDEKERRDSLALTRRLTSHESAMRLTSPRGLMLHGDVGTGKSMLIDLFADCLPTRKKRRWHFNTFMLETFARLEHLRHTRLAQPAAPSSGSEDDDYSLLWLAKEMIQTSPILFLDEFQMPDRVASKILTNLMTSFFHLGGVLIATSNRMPEELAKASGVEFSPPPSRMESPGWQFGMRRRSGSSGLYGGQNEFAAFLDVLKARCAVWEMEGGRDYRRAEPERLTSAESAVKEESSPDVNDGVQTGNDMSDEWVSETAVDGERAAKVEDQLPSDSVSSPKYYHRNSQDGADTPMTFDSILRQATGGEAASKTRFAPTVMKVYGRTVPIPRAYNGISEWTFDELCKTTLGPADYISLASTYHTLLLHDVPVLTWLMKNEARRFITLLDALYECRCKLFISAAAGPDDLFFPEQDKKDDNEDAVYSETLSEVYQDVTAPFRPNILTENPNYAEPSPEPDYTHARLAGLLRADALEDGPPNKPHRHPFRHTDAPKELPPIDPDEQRPVHHLPDFSKTSAFTGEDERFAYKRAQSRLWELCSARWWARSEPGWHRPLPLEVRRWERDFGMEPQAKLSQRPARGDGTSDVRIGDATVDETRDERMFRHGASPFRTSRDAPPRFSWTHIWGTMRWGPKAGAWGRGVEGLKDRGGEKR